MQVTSRTSRNGSKMKKQRLLLLAKYLRETGWLKLRCFNRKGFNFEPRFDYDPLCCMNLVFPNDWHWVGERMTYKDQFTPYKDMAAFFDVPFIDIWILFTFKGPLCEEKGKDMRLT